MATSQTEEATDKKSGTVQESISNESKPEELPVADDALDEEKAEAEAEPEAEVNDEPEAKVTVEAEDETEAEEETEAEAEAKAKADAEAEEESKAETEAAEENGEPEAEAEAKAKAEAEAKAKAEAEAKAKAEAEAKAKAETEANAKAEAEAKAKAETEAKAEAEAEEKAKAEAEEKAKAEAEGEAEAETEEEAEIQEETEAEAEPEAEEKAKVEEEEDNPEAEAAVEAETEEKAETKEKIAVSDQNQKSTRGKVSETIQKMTQSPAVLPGESGKTTMAHITVPATVCAKDIMQKDVVWANPNDNVQQALTKMQQQDSSYIIVGQDRVLEGIVSKSDITGATSIYLRPIFAKWHGPSDNATLQIKLKWIMSRPVRTVRPETLLATIIDNMCRFGARGLPVVDEQGTVHGLVTVFDIFRALSNTSEDISVAGKTAEAPEFA